MLHLQCKNALQSMQSVQRIQCNDDCACRGYPQKKITENVECEIMQVIADEAQEAYK